METNLPPENRARRWPVALLVGLVTGVVAAFAIVPIGDWLMRMHHVSEMEGARSCAVVAIWMPAAAIVGFLVGIGATLLVRRSGFAGYFIRQGIALAAAAVLIALVDGIGYATMDNPPSLNQKPLALEIQVEAPRKGRSVSELRAQDFSVALLASASDNRYADLRWSEAAATDETLIVSAWATLNSRNSSREISVGTNGEDRQLFTVLLPAAPKKIDEQWSPWSEPRTTFSGRKPAPNEQYRVRYRVRFAQEYSPTPGYTPATTPAPAGDDSLGPSPTPTPDEGKWSPPNDWLDRGLVPPSPTETPH